MILQLFNTSLWALMHIPCGKYFVAKKWGKMLLIYFFSVPLKKKKNNNKTMITTLC